MGPADDNHRFSVRRALICAAPLRAPSVRISARGISSVTKKPFLLSQKPLLFPFQRRYASEEASADSTAEEALSETGESGTEAATVTEPAAETSSATSSVPIEEEPVSPQDPIVPEPSADETIASKSGAAGAAVETVTAAASSAASAIASATGLSSAPRQPRGRPGASLYCGNLFFEVRDDDLRKEFSKFGKVTNARVIYDGRGLSKGYCRVFSHNGPY